MSLFLFGNSAEMRETEGKLCGKKLEFISVRKFCHFGLIWTNISETEGNSAGQNQRHGNEFIYVRNSAEMRETEGKSCTLTFLFMLV